MNLINNFIDLINNYNFKNLTNKKDLYEIKYTKDKIIYKDLIVEVDKYNLSILKKFSNEKVIKMICKYSAILSNSLSWGIPHNEYN